MKTLLSSTVAWIALCSAPVLAQAEPSGPAAPSNNNASQSSAAIEDIVVTAERRAANVQAVPMAISAFNAKSLATANVTEMSDLTKIAPGLNFTASTYAYQPTIRGVGSRGTGGGDESNVAVYIDGVYQPDQYTLNFDLDHVERVEVLKGPQGTLFGRNATGGAINVISSAPSFTPVGDFSATYGRFAYKRVSGRYSGPISDVLAYAVSGSVMKENGYLDNIALNQTYGGRKYANARGSLLFKPSSNFSVEVTAVYDHRDDYNAVASNAFMGIARARSNVPGILVASEPYEVSETFNPYTKVKHLEYSLHAKWDVGPFSIGYVGSLAHNSLGLTFDNDLVAADLNSVLAFYHTNTTIHDLQFTSNDAGRFKWIVGLNYFHSAVTLDLTSKSVNFNALNGIAGTGSTVIGSSVAHLFTDQKADSYSGYAEGTYELLDHLFITGGARYTDEKHQIYGISYSPASLTGSNQATFKNTTLHASARYDFGRTNVYASFSQGFKSGLFNGTTVSVLPEAVKPEKINSYEVGIKSDISSNLRANIALFHYDYTDLQVQASLNSSLIQLINAAKAKISGLDADLTFRPTSSLTLRSGVSLLDDKYTSFPGASATIPNTTTNPPNGGIAVIQDASGNKLIRTPDWTASFAADWTRPFAGGRITLSGNVFATGKYYWDVLNIYSQKSYATVSAGLSWDSLRGIHIKVSGDNLTNHAVATYVLPSTSGTSAVYTRPRFVSGTVGFDF